MIRGFLRLIISVAVGIALAAFFLGVTSPNILNDIVEGLFGR